MSEQKKSLSVVTIMPPPNQKPGSAQATQGTKVILSDGSELSRVTGVTLTANRHGVWEATITVLPEIIQPVDANATIVIEDATCLEDDARRYARAGLHTEGCAQVSAEGTTLLERGEVVVKPPVSSIIKPGCFQ